jgi:carbon starvation protein CstA
VLSAPYWLLIRLDLAQEVRHGAVALILVLTVLISAPFRLAVSALLPRELEGMLVLLTVVAMASGLRLRRRGHLRFA